MIYNVTLGANNLLTYLLVYKMLLYDMIDIDGLMGGFSSLSYVSIAYQH